METDKLEAEVTVALSEIATVILAEGERCVSASHALLPEVGERRRGLLHVDGEGDTFDGRVGGASLGLLFPHGQQQGRAERT